MVINTLNESSLHKKLKEIYSLEEGSRREVEENGKIYDIITGQGEIIEIQTRNLSKLLPKILDLLEKGKKIKIVHPYIKEKIINTYSEKGELLSSRKSPKKENIYSAFRELTGLYPVLLNKDFSLDLLEISMTEIRIQTSEAIQSPNKMRRFNKNWIKKDKILNEILSSCTLNKKEDYLALLPENLNQEFTRKEIENYLKSKKYKQNSYTNASLFVWVLEKMNLIEFVKKEGRSKVYKITKE